MADFSNDLFTKVTPQFDVTFIVEGGRLYMNKTVLGLVSPVFQTMFEGDYIERSASEIPLPGKRYNDILQFFHAIFPSTMKPVDDTNFEVLLSLADEYQVDTLKVRCELFAVGDLKNAITKNKLVHYLLLAEKYVRTTLLEESVAKSEDFLFSGENSLSSCEYFDQLSADTKYRICARRLQSLEPAVISFKNSLSNIRARLDALFSRNCNCTGQPNDELKICSPCVRRFETLTIEFSETFST